MSTNTSIIGSSSRGGQTQMDKRLLQAATSGDSTSMRDMASNNPSILLGTTPQGNTCLHISCTHGQKDFCRAVLELADESLLGAVNLDEETPLVAAVRNGHVSLAYYLLESYCASPFRNAIRLQDRDGSNALHHAIRNGHKELALELIAVEPALSRSVNEFDESPMYMAAMRDFTHVTMKLLDIDGSAHGGQHGNNTMHAAVKNGNSAIAMKIMKSRPGLAREANCNGTTPINWAVYRAKIDVLRVLLEHDCSLGYEVTNQGSILLNSAASGGHVDVARELLNHCPDAPYRTSSLDSRTCLHTAVMYDQSEFIEFILRTPQLRKLINMQDMKGKTALHYAVQKCNPKIVAALLSHKDIDTTLIDKDGRPPSWELECFKDNAKTLNWACMLSMYIRPYLIFPCY